MESPLPRVETRWVYESPLVQISQWRCRAADDRTNPERAQPRHVITFVHSGNFRVTSPGEIGFLDCTRVGFFHARVPFQSRHPFGWHDRGSELALHPDTLQEIVGRYDFGASERPDRPFPVGSGPCGPEDFLLQRFLVRCASRTESRDALQVEELAVLLADRLVRASLRERATFRDRDSRPPSREVEEAERLRGVLSAQPGRRHRLDTLARLVESTPIRLCRAFRLATGTTIHRYLTQVRLQQAIDRLADGFPDLSEMALGLGFSSHSHFTSVFRRHLGVPPEAVRRAAGGRDIASLRRRLAPASTAAEN